MAHVFIAGAHKSSGKTSIALGMTAALIRRGLSVQPFKKGPDYIDPIWLSRAAGRSCYNLDFFTQSGAEIKTTFARYGRDADISVIEGNKGLFDGLDVEGSDSNAALATLLQAPVVLVIDCTGMTRGIAPLLRGYLDFEQDVEIRGVILNKVGGARHEGKLRAALERYTDAQVLGAIGRDAALEIPERHLGLVPANELNDAGGAAATRGEAADRVIAALADIVAAGVELDRVVEIARAAGSGTGSPPIGTTAAPGNAGPGLKIAIARDAAFGFYYPDDLEAFAAAGAELVPFDTLRDSRLPAVDGLFLGGGFPETQLAALAANRGLLGDIRQALAAGTPAYAECGGLMYLARSILWQGERRDMVGAIPADVVVCDRPQGRGYVLLEETGQHPWPLDPEEKRAEDYPAHEFHHGRLEDLPRDVKFAYRVKRGAGVDGRHDGIVIDNLLAGFAHHRNTAAGRWVERFVRFVRENSHRGA